MNKKLSYCILLSTSWQDSIKLDSALKFCCNLLDANHKIQTLFLQYDSVSLAGVMNIIPDEEVDMGARWQEFVAKNRLNAHVCINSALRRGIVDEAMAKQYQKPCASISPLFQLSPLGVLFDSMQLADRFVQL